MRISTAFKRSIAFFIYLLLTIQAQAELSKTDKSIEITTNPATSYVSSLFNFQDVASQIVREQPNDKQELMKLTSKFGFGSYSQYRNYSMRPTYKLRDNQQPKNRLKKQKQDQFKNKLFGATAIKFGQISAGKNLTKHLNEAEQTKNIMDNCHTAQCKQTMDFFQVTSNPVLEDFEAKLRRVNSIVNRSINYRTDLDSIGIIDDWSSPYETANRGFGDCEDYAILKLEILANLGIDKNAMSVVVLKDVSRQLYHAVLSVRTDQGHYILDNVETEVLRDTEINHYRPIYAISAGGNQIFGFERGTDMPAMAFTGFERIAPGASIQQ